MPLLSPEAPVAGAQPPPGLLRRELAAERVLLVAEARRLAAACGCETLAKQIDVQWNSRLRTTAGLASSARSLIMLNPRLRAHPAELPRTLRHELAHLVAATRHPRRRLAPHGPEWRRACADLGIAEEPRCHRLELAPPRRVVRLRYECPGCRRIILRVRRFRRGEACLPCCRRHAGGRYDRAFRLVLQGPVDPADLAPEPRQ